MSILTLATPLNKMSFTLSTTTDCTWISRRGRTLWVPPLSITECLWLQHKQILSKQLCYAWKLGFDTTLHLCLALTFFPSPLEQCSLSLGSSDTDNLFIAEHSTFSYFQHQPVYRLLQVLQTVCRCKNKLLWSKLTIPLTYRLEEQLLRRKSGG